MNTCLMKNTQIIKTTASDIVSIILPLHNIYIYECAGMYLNSNSNTLDLPYTPNAQEVCWQPFEFNFTITISVI